MGKSAALKKNIAWSFAGNIFYAFCQWLILLVLARTGDPALVGQFSLAMAVTAPVILFSNLKLRDILATDTNNDYHFSQYFTLRAWSIAAAVLVIIMISILGNYRFETFNVIVAVALVKGAESVSDIVYGRYQQKENLRIISVSLSLRGLLSVAIFYFMMRSTGSLLLGCLGLLLARLAVLVLYDIKNIDISIRDMMRNTKLIKLLRISFPLGTAALIVSLIPNIPNYLIEKYQGEYQLGLFASLMYFQVIGNTLVLALGQAASPRLTRLYSRGETAKFAMLFLKMLMIGIAAGAAGIIVAEFYGPEILNLLLGKVYSGYSSLFVLVMVSTAIAYFVSLTGYALLAVKRYMFQLWVNIAVLSVTVVSGMLLIPVSGIYGAAYSLIYAMLTQAVLNTGIILYQTYKDHNLKLVKNGIHL